MPLEGLQVTVDSILAVHTRDSRLPWERRLRITRLRRQIFPRGPLTEEHRQLLLRGAESCPVDRTLTNAVAIDTELVHMDDPAMSEENVSGGDR